MKKYLFLSANLTTMAIFLSACTIDTTSGAHDKALIGAGTGAAVGALIGNAVGDDKAKSTRNGALIGAVVGGIIGNDLDKQEAELRDGLSGSGASIVNTGDRLIVTLPEAITFPVNGTTVKSSLQAPLAQISRSLNAYPKTIAQVVGHTDNAGTSSYNQMLSESRARAVANILIGAGTPSSRVSVVGRGEQSPVASNATDAGRQANRRVEINIVPTQ